MDKGSASRSARRSPSEPPFDPYHPYGVQRPLLQNQKRLTPLVFGSAAAVVLLFAVLWYVMGLPSAPVSVRRALGVLPEAGERALPSGPGIGLQFGKSREQVGLFTGLPCPEWKRRPIAVMLGSDPIARPLSGMAEADLVIEMPALTNNVTRQMAVYQCGHPKEIGGVRSARHDYLFLAKGLDAVIAHWGGSYHALNRIRFEFFPNGAPVYESIDALRNPFNAYYRISRLRAPYNGYTTYERLWEGLGKLGYRTYSVFQGYPHRPELPKEQRGQGALDVGWPGSMRVRYVYHPETNVYERFWGGQRHLDGVDAQPVNPRVVVIMHAEQRLAQGPGGYNDVDVEGSGKAEVYQNGHLLQGTWQKSDIRKEDPLTFRTALGETIEFAPGQIWIHVVDSRTPVTWTPGSGTPPEPQAGETPTNLGD
ncbi:MAG: hypothetical protein G01um101438_808 [Parcubacteria group bacterium Gr01-1014_38]|nr:MAG: hypothetical protein G01um101438_808 [Parcubacteria group bacterium Gr01-1014_38]